MPITERRSSKSKTEKVSFQLDQALRLPFVPGVPVQEADLNGPERERAARCIYDAFSINDTRVYGRYPTTP